MRVPTAVKRLTGSPARAFACIFLLAFAVRGLLLASWMIPTRFVAPDNLTEVQRTARTLATAGRFADPYAIPTGPTAHPLPLYTGLLGLIYSLAGITLTAEYLRCLVNVAAYSALYGLLPFFAARAGLGLRPGLIAGLAAAALVPQQFEEILGLASGEAFAAVALLALLAAWMSRWTAPDRSAAGALLIGLGFGAAALLSPALLPVAGGCAAFEAWRGAGRRRWHAVAMAAGVILALAPWVVRNHVVLGAPMMVRSNFGLELRISNGDAAVADLWSADAATRAAIRHPGGDLVEARAVRDLGEVEYMRRARREAVAWIAERPGRFLRLTVTRAFDFWFGPWPRLSVAVPTTLVTVLALLGLRRSWRELAAPPRAAILIPLAGYPLVYYLVAYSPRYAVPVSGILLVLAGAAVWGRGGASSQGS